MTFDPFVSIDTYKRDLYRPIRKPGDPADEKIGWVELRPLNAGDRAEFNEIQIRMEGTAGIDVGGIQLHMVHRAIISWSFEKPVTVETVRALDPDVFDQIYEHTSMGNPTLADQLDEAKEPDPLDDERDEQPAEPVVGTS